MERYIRIAAAIACIGFGLYMVPTTVYMTAAGIFWVLVGINSLLKRW